MYIFVNSTSAYLEPSSKATNYERSQYVASYLTISTRCARTACPSKDVRSGLAFFNQVHLGACMAKMRIAAMAIERAAYP